MTKLISLTIILSSLILGAPAYAGKHVDGMRNNNLPTSMQGTSSQCSGPQYHYRNNPCAPQATPTPPAQPQGGCGHYSHNGVLIQCE